jgi:hypothetical protein
MTLPHGNACLAAIVGGLVMAACAPEQSPKIAFADAVIEPAAAPPTFDIDEGPNPTLFPPNPEPGHCYARVLLPATYNVSEEKVLVRSAETKIEVEDARYEWVDEAVLVKEATTRVETLPAEYETVNEKVLVRPEGKKLIHIPAKYELVTERILDKPAHTVWKRGSGPIDNALKTTYDESTGEVMCLVEVPATYKTVEKRVLVVPAATKEVNTPAEYRTVSKKRLKTPATTREVTTPAEYETVRVQKLVQAAKEREVVIPPLYESVTKRVKVTDEELAWREVLCDVNMTSDVIRTIQAKLSQAGHYRGNVDGKFGPMTIRAVNDYAKAKDLPVGSNYVATETAKALGIDS